VRLQAFGGTRLARRHNGVSLAHEADNFQIFVLEEQPKLRAFLPQAFGMCSHCNIGKRLQQSRQLEVTLPEDTYLRGGWFNKDAMLVLTEEVLKSGRTPAIAETAQLLE